MTYIKFYVFRKPECHAQGVFYNKDVLQVQHANPGTDRPHWNVDRAKLNTVFENTAQLVNKCLETGRGHFEHYL
jgi:hypothetical protein